MGGGDIVLGVGGVILACIFGAVLLGFGIYFFIAFLRVIGRLIVHVFRTLGSMIADSFRLIGAVIVALIFVPLTVLNVAIGRWSASAHYGRAFTSECRTIGSCAYRVLIGHPLRLFGLGGLTEGIEQRLPQAMAAAPGSDKPSKRQGMFEGYTIVGSLQGGGSGGRLYIAEPDEMKRAAFARRGAGSVDRVVIKTFSLTDGSSLPQIVRESRALDAAKKLGLVLEHDLTAERFFYVMRYVPGDSLSVVTQRMHASSPPVGLDDGGLRHAVGYTSDLLASLDTYHRGGLWHKDVKPDNLIVDRESEPGLGRGRAHLVDFGLITPLRSAMTLTTHGTEYFRDPELVRQALRGVKVHEIDGAKFDVYAAGAVLYSLIENSFPAHGGLSQVSKRCPEALRWIIRRAMTDYDKRYGTAREMLDDLAAVAASADVFAVRPADLPSVRGAGGGAGVTPEPIAAAAEPAASPNYAGAGQAAAVAGAAAFAAAGRTPPKLRVANWWSGRYETAEGPGEVAGAALGGGPAPGVVLQADPGVEPRRSPAPRAMPGRSAAEQLASARQRVADRRASLQRRSKQRLGPAAGPTALGARGARRHEPAGVNAGVVVATLFVTGAIVGGVAIPAFVKARNEASAHSEALANEARAEHDRAELAQAAMAPPPPEVGDALVGLVPAPTRELSGLGLAVLCDFRPPYDQGLLSEIGAAGVGLGAAGVRLVSNIPLVDHQVGDAQDAVLLARLLAARGQATLDEALAPALAAIVAEEPALDAVWWIGPGDEPGERRYLLLDERCSTAVTTLEIGLDDVAASFVSQGSGVASVEAPEPPATPEQPG